jgi:hypothetical protein
MTFTRFVYKVCKEWFPFTLENGAALQIYYVVFSPRWLQ